MSDYGAIHESRMSDLGMILPRVGGGVREGVGACILYLTGCSAPPVDNSQRQPSPTMHGASRIRVAS